MAPIAPLKQLYVRYKRLSRYMSSDLIDLQAAPPLSDELAASLAPVFVLSTGRCGTKWLTETLSRSHQVFVNHSLQPQLIRQSARAYELSRSGEDGLPEIVRATRDDMLAAVHQAGRTYVETNNRITFFAGAIARAYPHSKFIHLYRHPGDFVRSGMRRGWYLGQSHDVGRIVLGDAKTWEAMSQFDRIAWLWNETNDFIEHVMADIPPDRRMSVKSEDMFDDMAVVLEIQKFVGITDIDRRDIQAMVGKRVNAQKRGEFPTFEAWTEEQKRSLTRWCPLASRYGYHLGT